MNLREVEIDEVDVIISHVMIFIQIGWLLKFIRLSLMYVFIRWKCQ